ncbi:MAG: transcriptional regulator [Bacteroidota bacterium]
MDNEGRTAYAKLAQLDRVIHEPARLAIMAVLYGCAAADFEFLLRMTGLTKGNLSAHASRLEEAGFVRVEKGFEGKRPYTRYALTPDGRRAFAAYRELLGTTLVAVGNDPESTG